MSKIYYIEDNKQHFESLSQLLRDNNYEVFPPSDKWEDEKLLFIEFLYEQASIEKKRKIQEIFLMYNPDLLVIDIDLGVNESGDGEDIYRNFILKSEFKSTPVIYLTIVGKAHITLYTKTKHVLKVLKKLNELDTNAIKNDLLKNINDLLKVNGNKSFLDRIIDSI